MWRTAATAISLVMTMQIVAISIVHASENGTGKHQSDTTQSSSTSPSSNASASKTGVVSPVIQGAVQKKSTRINRKIDFGQSKTKHSSNNFQDISASMPAAAVKENLARKHELPSAETAVLRPGGGAGAMSGNGIGAQAAKQAAAQGSKPEILLPNGVAVPESKGATSNGFYK